MILKTFSLVCFVLCILVEPAVAKVEWEVKTQFVLDNAPMEVKVSAKGKWIFVLSDDNKILIYSPDGKLKDTLNPGYPVSSITPGPQDNILLLNSLEKKKIEVINFSFIEVINTMGSPVKGDENSPVEIVVFSDFQCPYCARLTPVLEEVLSLYPGIVKIVFKHYPLKTHDMALKAAAVSIMAERKGKFWETHDRLFDNYNQLSEKKILEIAMDAGLDEVTIQRNWKNKRTYQQIYKDIIDGQKAGVDGVPKVFINGRVLKNRDLNGFKTMIKQETVGLETPNKNKPQ